MSNQRLWPQVCVPGHRCRGIGSLRAPSVAADLLSGGKFSQLPGTIWHPKGVRIALGASRASIFSLVLAQALLTAAAGVALGIVAALALTRTMGSLLFGMSPNDPLTFAAVALLLTAVALLASYFPARRATRVDPMVALRYE
jgi:hypothetical protein